MSDPYIIMNINCNYENIPTPLCVLMEKHSSDKGSSTNSG